MTQTSPERWREIEALMDRVLDAPESERGAILDAVGSADPDLREQVERLLAASEDAGTRFDTPPLLVARDVLQTTLDAGRDQFNAGDILGTYRIIRLLGRGGMGAVYQAERADGAFEKTVAIKIVKRGMDTDEIIRRFRRERRILARLEHPNIAGLIDGGITDDGLPYFVMELAEGDPIDEWCDRHTLLLRERLQLFERVCDAVQYAHGNLVVHRDIKPGNILVADEGVKLLDFGIAKLLGPEDSAPQVTQVHEARLTPQYAAPEQIRGQATTTSTDVYSLGALLYELLVGRPPYRLDGCTMLEIEQIICTIDPAPPSVCLARARPGDTSADEIAHRRGIGRAQTLQQQLRGDLDAICLKALRKAPDERYVSASAMAEDIKRYLDGRAVHAHPPSRRYKLRKFVRRNRASVALGSIATIALVGGSITVAVLGRQAAVERDLRQTEAERATAARDFMINTLSSFDPDAQPGQLDFSAHDLVERGRDNLDELDVQPPLKASVMNTLGQVAFNLGERDIAESLFREAYDILVAEGGGPDLAVSNTGIGLILQRDGRYDEAIDWFRSALRIRRDAGGDVRALAESQRALAFALYNKASTQAGPDREPAIAEATALYTAILEETDTLPDVRSGALEGLADLELLHENFESADSLYRQVLEYRVAAQPEDHPDIARLLWGIVSVQTGLGQFAEAERTSREALRILLKAYDTEHRDVVFGYLFLGKALRAQGKNADAAEAFGQAASVSERVNAAGHAYTAESWYRQGEAELALGRRAEAESALRRAKGTYFEGARAKADSLSIGDDVARIDLLLSELVEAAGRLAEARDLAAEAASMAVSPDVAEEAATRLAALSR